MHREPIDSRYTPCRSVCVGGHTQCLATLGLLLRLVQRDEVRLASTHALPRPEERLVGRVVTDQTAANRDRQRHLHGLELSLRSGAELRAAGGVESLKDRRSKVLDLAEPLPVAVSDHHADGCLQRLTDLLVLVVERVVGHVFSNHCRVIRRVSESK